MAEYPSSTPFRMPDGTTRDVELSVSPIEPVGRFCHVPGCTKPYAGRVYFNQDETINADFCFDHLKQLESGKLNITKDMINDG